MILKKGRVYLFYTGDTGTETYIGIYLGEVRDLNKPNKKCLVFQIEVYKNTGVTYKTMLHQKEYYKEVIDLVNNIYPDPFTSNIGIYLRKEKNILKQLSIKEVSLLSLPKQYS